MATDDRAMRPLSEMLADLAQRAKEVEDAFAAARTENKQKLEAHLDQARASFERFRDQVQQNASVANDRARDEWQDVQGRITKRVNKIKSDVEVRRQQFTADRADMRADLAADEATAAIADASGAIEYARFAVLSAVAARADANTASR
jgi:gas vesicle protein